MQPLKLFLGQIPLLLLVLIHASVSAKRHVVRLSDMRNRVTLRRMGFSREDLKPKICYELVGCFADPPHHTSLKRAPEHPNVIQTRFLLFTQDTRQTPDYLHYGDESRSLVRSRFNATKRVKVVIHGYKGSGSGASILQGMHNILDLEDVNVIVLDWTRGAGTTYGAAVANTELVGRQLALLLLNVIDFGTDPLNIHAIGFSLGAHVAGCASEVLKRRNIIIGRITGLDPASPFFRHHLFREKSRKLDATDAQLVDVVHTDGSVDFADGFGLLKPIGHIDFFPNGGREQPGCVDVKNSVVVSHLKEDQLTTKLACSHLRAWALFLESLSSQLQGPAGCKFNAWPCPREATSYAKGTCFPLESTEWSQELGYAADRGPLGIYYLPTRGEPPYCGIHTSPVTFNVIRGSPVRMSVKTSEAAPKTFGVLRVQVLHDNSTTLFEISCTLPNRKNEWTMFYKTAAAPFESITKNQTTVQVTVSYEADAETAEEEAARGVTSNSLLIDKLTLEDRKGNRWEYCTQNLKVSTQELLIALHN